MATLLNTTTELQITLRSQHIFGRHPGSSNTILENPEASRLHASIVWNGSHWFLQDSSSNGTFINQQLIQRGIKKKLSKGDVIQFGARHAITWIFDNDQAPKSQLMPLRTEHAAIELSGVVVLPNDTHPELTLYQSSQGQWLCEDHAGTTQLQSGSQVSTREFSWYFVDAEVVDSTKKADQSHNMTTAPITFSFNVSKNEEHVSLVIRFNSELIDLGERTHHYLLLLLARKRMEDHDSGIEESEQGWITKELLCQQMGMSENHINIHIYRFRKQLIDVRPSDMQLLQIVERRRGELRFALTSVEIKGGHDSIKQQ